MVIKKKNLKGLEGQVKGSLILTEKSRLFHKTIKDAWGCDRSWTMNTTLLKHMDSFIVRISV